MAKYVESDVAKIPTVIPADDKDINVPIKEDGEK